MSVQFEVWSNRSDSSLNSIKDAIVQLGVQTRDSGAKIVSPTGSSLAWLIDLRRVFLDRNALLQISEVFWQRYRDRPAFQLGGMETAAIPLLMALLWTAPSSRGSVNGFIVRKERKKTGLGNAIEGEVTPDPIILVDDIVNSGESAGKALAVLQSINRTIDELFTVIDYRSKPGLQWRLDQNIPVVSLFDLDDFGLILKASSSTPKQRYRLLWRNVIEGANPHFVVPKSAPLLVGHRIYRGCDAGKMHAFDADTGATLWEYQALGTEPNKGIWSSPVHHEGRLYFGAYNGCVYCLDAVTGREIWARSYGEWIGASPLIVAKHGLLYVGIEFERPWGRGSLAALDIKTGRKVWEHQITKLQHGSPAYWNDGDLIVWGSADYQMLAMEALTGNVVWAFDTQRSVKYAPAVNEARGLVAFASFDKSIYLLDVATGKLRGEWKTNDICYTTPLFAGNKLFCGSGDRHLYVIDVQQNALIKKINLHARIYSSPQVVEDRIIVGTSGGRVYEIDVDTLEIVGALQVSDAVTNAVIVDDQANKIFVSTYMNRLYAFERISPIEKEVLR